MDMGESHINLCFWGNTKNQDLGEKAKCWRHCSKVFD